MWWKRDGRPRSATRHTAPKVIPTSDTTRARRRNIDRPLSWAPRASADEPAASPPLKKYAGIHHFHTGRLRIGRP